MQAPPTIELDDAFVLDGWRLEDAASHRTFAEDADAARFLGWTVEEARAAPDSYYVDGMRQLWSRRRFGVEVSRLGLSTPSWSGRDASCRSGAPC